MDMYDVRGGCLLLILVRESGSVDSYASPTAARASVQERFSEAAFSDAFCASLAPALAV